MIHRSWELIGLYGAIGPDTIRGQRFGRFGNGSVICFPTNTILNEHYIHIGAGTMIGPQARSRRGWSPASSASAIQWCASVIGCLIGKGSGIVGHLSIDIGNDVWTGHHVYITDQNHGYEDITKPISQQRRCRRRQVTIGDGSWLGFGTVVLPGSTIGRHVTVGANSVVTGELPDYCVAVGAPAKVIRQYRNGEGWKRVSDFDENVDPAS